MKCTILTSLAVSLLFTGSALAANDDNPKPVEITNTPLPVTGTVDANVVNVPAVVIVDPREPFQENFSTSYSPPDSSWSAESEPVPDFYRLSVEFMTINYPTARAVSELGSCTVWVLTEPDCTGSLVGKIAMSYRVPTTSARRRGEVDDFLETSAALPIRLFVEEGQTICVQCPLPDDNNLIAAGGGQVSVSGYLEPVTD